jgi:two-component system response regulator (stage 0 sporulation protein A)
MNDNVTFQSEDNIMSELEMKVEALMRCVPQEKLNAMLREVSGSKEKEQQSLTQIIHSTLSELGTPAHIKGYRYLAYALELAVEDESILEVVTKGLYPAIAQKFQTTPPRVERALRHAIETTWDRGELNVLYGYFGNTVSGKKGKPTNSEFIARIANTIQLARM